MRCMVCNKVIVVTKECGCEPSAFIPKSALRNLLVEQRIVRLRLWQVGQLRAVNAVDEFIKKIEELLEDK